MKEREMKSRDWWYLDKKQRLFMAIGQSATHVKKGEGDFFLRRWHHKIDHKRIFITIKEQKEMGFKRITRKESHRLTKLNDAPHVREYINRMHNVKEVKDER